MKRIIAVTAVLLLFSSGLYAKSKVEDVSGKDSSKRDEIKKKDEEHRQKIMKKFYDFRDRVRKMTPGFDIEIPVDAGETDDIKDQKMQSKTGKLKEFDAWVADSYKLRALPYDSVNEFTSTVKRGDKVKVVMKPDVTPSKEYKSLTKDWYLVRTSDGEEGYIPANLLLGKKPVKEKDKKKDDKKDKKKDKKDSVGMNDDIDMQFLFAGEPAVEEPAVDDQFTGRVEGLFVLAGYEEAKPGSQMKVNTSSLKVRSEPSFDGEVLGNLYKGNIVEIIEYSSNYDEYDGHRAKWAKVKSGDFEGWVFSYYLVEPGSDSGSGNEHVMTEFEEGDDLYVKPDILRVRDAPDENGTVVFSLQNKDEVEIIEVEPEIVSLGGKKSRWVKIEYEDYQGWVFGSFLSTDKAAFEQGDDIKDMFQSPIDEDKYFISSKFGKRTLKGKVSNHTGIDLAAPCGTDVKAAADGVVIKTVENSKNCSSCGYGSYVIIEHKNGIRTLYGHLSAVRVKEGQKVNAGDIIGAVGDTGHSFGCHLHFEVRANEEFVDPSKYLHP